MIIGIVYVLLYYNMNDGPDPFLVCAMWDSTPHSMCTGSLSAPFGTGSVCC